MSKSGWMLGGGATLALVGAAVLLGSAGIASGTAGASISISPPSQNIAAGTQEINIEIKANNVTNLGAYEITMTFDASVLEFVGAGDYGFLASTGRQQTCFGFGQSAATVNQYKVLHAGCATNGLLNNGQGKAGPNGTATLAQVVFKAKSIGTSNLIFKGLGTDKYYIGAPDPSLPDGAFESGQTSLTYVEVCPGGNLPCEEQNVEFAPGAGVIAVIDPNAPTPTALPPTPTPEPPSGVDDGDFRATVAAAVGTPRTLATPAAGTSAAAAATAASQNGTTAANTGTGPSGGVAGTTGLITGQGALPEGVTIGADGIPRGPDGVPVAGYGPQQQESNPMWVWGGIAVLLAGLVAMGSGAVLRRAAARDM